MSHSNHAVWGVMQDEIRWYKGPPSMAVCEHWNYEDKGKDFFGGYAFMSQGPLPADHAKSLASNSGMFGMEFRQRMALYNHMAGLKIVGETLPDENNRVELSDEVDEFGIPLAHVTFSFSENDKRLYKHSLRFMRQALEAAGASDFTETESTAHLMGGCRMGASPGDSVVNADGRTWDIRNLWIGDGSVFPTSGGVNPSLTIYALAARMADRIVALGKRGEL
jgi:choline dehydrogenase-like flavoprotein